MASRMQVTRDASVTATLAGCDPRLVDAVCERVSAALGVVPTDKRRSEPGHVVSWPGPPDAQDGYTTLTFAADGSGTESEVGVITSGTQRALEYASRFLGMMFLGWLVAQLGAKVALLQGGWTLPLTALGVVLIYNALSAWGFARFTRARAERQLDRVRAALEAAVAPAAAGYRIGLVASPDPVAEPEPVAEPAEQRRAPPR